jgi:hypothetical protein
MSDIPICWLARVIRSSGWFWLPVPWIWRGCFARDAARECVRQGWLELAGKGYRKGRISGE